MKLEPFRDFDENEVIDLPGFSLVNNKGRPKWDRFYLELAEFVANKLSKDPSTKVGAVLVNYEHNKEFIGYNGFPRGVKDDPERYNNRELKYKMVVHAEVNAILKADDYTRGSTLYVFPSFAVPPICCECVKLAIQKGVKEIVGYEVAPEDAERALRWKETIDIARQMCDEAGVKYRVISKHPLGKITSDLKSLDKSLNSTNARIVGNFGITPKLTEFIYERQGCIGDAYCPTCNENKSGTCFCMLVCPDCKGNMKAGFREKVPLKRQLGDG